MVDPIARRVSRIQSDFKKASTGKITEREVTGLIGRARQDGLTESEVKALKAEVKRYENSFTPVARLKIDEFLATAHKTTAFDVQKRQPGKLADPAAIKNDRPLLNQAEVKGGRLFIGDVKGSDAEQKYLGDCYLLAAMSSVAHSNPDAIKDAFKKNADGTYTVRVFEFKAGEWKPSYVKVDTDLPHDVKGRLNYATGNNPKELWPALLEKAFAAKGGGYSSIEGGIPGDALSAITGKTTTDLVLKGMAPEDVFAELKAALKAGKPTTAATKGESAEAQYTNSGVYTDHTYTVWATSVEKGQKFVHLRNPWGSGEPSDNGRDDGIFKLPLARFLELFPDIAING